MNYMLFVSCENLTSFGLYWTDCNWIKRVGQLDSKAYINVVYGMFLKLGCIQTAVGERMVNGEAKGLFFICTMLCIVGVWA